MNNLSSLSKAVFAIYGGMLLALVALVDAGIAKDAKIDQIVLCALVLLFSVFAAYYARRFRNALAMTEKATSQAAQGDFDLRIVRLGEKGDLQKLADNINNLIDMADAFVRETRHSMEIVSQGNYYRKVIEKGLPGYYRRSASALNAVTSATEKKVSEFHGYADNFESNAKGVVNKVAQASRDLQYSAKSMSGVAETTSQQSDAASHASNRSAQNVQTVAAAAEELTASITEISQRVSESSTIAALAAKEAEKTNASVQSLSDVAQKVGEVVNLINDIASQTNLLALNATIEAARAGEAGKGFAVVASEVKNLANQTAKATEDITKQIGAIQSETERAVEAIRSIGNTIHQVNDISAGIAGAVEEQRAATQEIARNVQEAAASTSEVTENIEGVSHAAIETKKASGLVLGAAEGLTTEANLLQQEVDKFLVAVRSM